VLRANRRINWVMGVNTSDYNQVRSVAMLKFGLGVKFYGNQLSREIRDYPKLLKHNGKVWIISKEFLNVKPSASSEIKYSERFWARACKAGESDFRARVMPSKSNSRRNLHMRTKAEERRACFTEYRSLSFPRKYALNDKVSNDRQQSLERKLALIKLDNIGSPMSSSHSGGSRQESSSPRSASLQQGGSFLNRQISQLGSMKDEDFFYEIGSKGSDDEIVCSSIL